MSSADTPLPCQVHRTHSPKPLRTDPHHIWPRGMAGPDTPENRVQVCPTGHVNIHRCLDDLLAGRKPNRGTKRERALAQQGYADWLAAGKPGQPVYELHTPEETP